MAKAADSPFKGQDLNFKIKWAPLWMPSDKEQADIEKTTAEKDNIYATIGAATPEQIAQSRWGKAGFVGTGMSGWDPDQAERDAGDNQMFAHMLNPPPELQGRTAGAQAAQGQQQPGAMGPDGQPVQPQAPIGAGASPFGATKDPRQVLKTLHEPPDPTKP